MSIFPRHAVEYGRPRFVWDLDKDAACDAGDLPWVNNHSDGLSNIANITAHELAEMLFGPLGCLHSSISGKYDAIRVGMMTIDQALARGQNFHYPLESLRLQFRSCGRS